MKTFARDSTQSLFVVMGALYAASMFLGVNNASSVQPIVSIERTVFYREKAAGMYSPLAYAAAQVKFIQYEQKYYSDNHNVINYLRKIFQFSG